MKIITNNQPRDIIEAYELPIEVRDEFDYLDWTNIEMGQDSAQFIKYKGEWYDLSEFETTSRMIGHEFAEWDGYRSDSFFSGILVKFPTIDGFCQYECVVVGRYYS